MNPSEVPDTARIRGLWPLDPDVAYLNHGSFGACPRAILEHQADLRREMERQPVAFFMRELAPRLEATRAVLGEFLGADPDGLAFVVNATTGVNAAVRAWDLAPGDEILTTDHAYPACRKAMAFIAERRRARVVVAPVPFPLRGPDEVVDAVLASVTRRTRLAVLDHVTSPTALVFPVGRLVPALRERGVETVVDGAHAPGMLPLRLDEIGAAVYTGNAHKWMAAPKGAGILYVRADQRHRVRPLVVSHGYDPEQGGLRFRAEWDWTGTLDPTPWLCLPECLRFLGGLLPGGWDALMRRNHDLVCRGRQAVLDGLEVARPCPESMLGAMASVPLPEAAAGSPVARLDVDRLATWTRERGIESWFHPWPGEVGKVVRLSAQVYNDESQYHALAALLGEALREG